MKIELLLIALLVFVAAWALNREDIMKSGQALATIATLALLSAVIAGDGPAKAENKRSR